MCRVGPFVMGGGSSEPSGSVFFLLMSAPLRRDGAAIAYDDSFYPILIFLPCAFDSSFSSLFSLSIFPLVLRLSILILFWVVLRLLFVFASSFCSFFFPFSLLLLLFSLSSILLSTLSSLLLFSHPTVNHTPLHDVSRLRLHVTARGGS